MMNRARLMVNLAKRIRIEGDIPTNSDESSHEICQGKRSQEQKITDVYDLSDELSSNEKVSQYLRSLEIKQTSDLFQYPTQHCQEICPIETDKEVLDLNQNGSIISNSKNITINADELSSSSVISNSNSYTNDENDLFRGLHPDSGSEYVPSDSEPETEMEDSSGTDFLTDFPKKIPINKKYVKYRALTSKDLEKEVPPTSRETQEEVPTTSRVINNPYAISFNNGIDTKNCSEQYGVADFSLISDRQKYSKSASARERPTICPLCFDDVKTHFSRHLIRHHKNHKDVMLLQTLPPRSKERLSIVAALRKQGYFHLKVEKDILNPVKRSKNPDAKYFACMFCLGHYTKNNLYKHVKICKSKPETELKPGKNCLNKSQTFMAIACSKNNDFLKSSRIRQEVFSIMRPDEISAVVKTDPLICLYGEALLSKHKRQQISVVVSNKMREMGRLLIIMRKMNPGISCLFDFLKPEMFQTMVAATKCISGYDETAKKFRAPSLVLHIGTNLKLLCDIGFKIVLEKRSLPGIKWTDPQKRRSEIKDLKKLIEGHWCTELSSLALKSLKENHWEKPILLPLTSDIQIFQEYIVQTADQAFENLNSNQFIEANYRLLTECVLAQTVMFNRRRVGDVQFLKIDSYIKDYKTVNQECFMESLTQVEKILYTKFKRVVTGGKGSKPVAILFSKQTQKYISCLLKLRTETGIVPQSNPYLFANPGSENRWMAGVNVLSKLAKNSGAANPSLLTSTKFRKHIATTLQLLSIEDNEMEQIATFMGHTKKTHTEFYRLPQDIYQTAKVAKILMLLEKGKGTEFKGKNLNDIELDNVVYYSSESDIDEKANKPLVEKMLNKISESVITAESQEKSEYGEPSTDNCCLSKVVGENVTNPGKENSDDDLLQAHTSKETSDKSGLKKSTCRVPWSEREKKLAKEYFANHIKRKIAPKKHECEELLRSKKDVFRNKDWIRLKTFIYNTYRNK